MAALVDSEQTAPGVGVARGSQQAYRDAMGSESDWAPLIVGIIASIIWIIALYFVVREAVSAALRNNDKLRMQARKRETAAAQRQAQSGSVD